MAQLCSEKQEVRLGPAVSPLSSHQRCLSTSSLPSDVLWLLLGRPGSTFWVLGRAGGVPWL